MAVSAPSSDFIDTLRFGAQLVVADLTLFEYSATGSIVSQISLPCSAAQITNDRNSAQRRSGSVTVELVPSVPPPALLPTAPPTPSAPQPLAPFGNEVAISLGLAVGNASGGPKAILEGSLAAGATIIQIADLTGQGLQFTIGDTIVVGSSMPSTVVGIQSVGSNSYQVYLVEGLSSAQPANASVQLVESVPLGLFTLTTTVVDATAPNLVVTLDVSDRSFVIDARQLVTPYTFPATPSGTYEEEVMALLNKAWGSYPSMPSLVYNFSDCNNPIVPASTYNQGSSPWQMALDLALVAGNELYIDENGVVTSHVYPNVNSAPVRWYFSDDTSNVFANPNNQISGGSPYQVPIGVQVTFTREGIYNDVYITGSGSQNAPGMSTSSSTATGAIQATSTTSASPVLGHAADTNPTSATDIYGPLGELPEMISSNLVPTPSQAQAMASLDLAMSISSSWQVQVTCQPNPILDVDDVVSVNYPSLGVNGPAVTNATNATLEGSIAEGGTAIMVTVPLGDPLPFDEGDVVVVGTSTPVTVTGIEQQGTNSWLVDISPGLSSSQSASAVVSLVVGYQGLCMIVDTVVTGVRYDDITTVTGRIIPGRYA
jgi:hypothetical protein